MLQTSTISPGQICLSHQPPRNGQLGDCCAHPIVESHRPPAFAAPHAGLQQLARLVVVCVSFSISVPRVTRSVWCERAIHLRRPVSVLRSSAEALGLDRARLLGVSQGHNPFSTRSSLRDHPPLSDPRIRASRRSRGSYRRKSARRGGRAQCNPLLHCRLPARI